MTEGKTFGTYVKDGWHISLGEVTIMFTSDMAGETLSLRVGDMMITAPYERIKEVITKERKNNEYSAANRKTYKGSGN